jgi:hypothetical protein
MQTFKTLNYFEPLFICVGVANVSLCAQFQEASTHTSRAIKQLYIQKQLETISMQYVLLNAIMYG